jgi:nitric oxide reductase NorD protein
MTNPDPHSATAILALLDEWLETEFTFIIANALAERLAAFSRREQDFLLDWTRRVASTNIQLGFEFAQGAANLPEPIDRPLLEAWAIHAMDKYDRAGLNPALAVIRDIRRFLRFKHEQSAGVVLEEIRGILLNFVHGLSGRRLQLEESEVIYTDSEILYLPPVLAEMPARADNFTLAKAAVALLWAQTRFGSFNLDLSAALAQFPQPEQALRWFQVLETARLEACLARELPGLFRQMQSLGGGAYIVPELSMAGASVADTLRCLGQIDVSRDAPPLPCYGGALRPQAVAACRAARIEKEKIYLRVKLAELAKEQYRSADDKEQAAAAFKLVNPPSEQQDLPQAWELVLDDMLVAPPEGVKQLLTSIFLDLGEIPPQYLVPAGDGEYDSAYFQNHDDDPDAVWQGTYHEQGAELYPEWDYGRRHYRKNWCTMREKEVTPIYDDFYQETLIKYGDLVRQLRRTFEAMREEDKLLKRQKEGENVDIDALIEGIADMRAGHEPPTAVYTKVYRAERNIAVLFMVDMSGSTKGWINDAERESLILLCEALEVLGDRYGIYGFSGMTRKRCELYRIKHLDEAYDANVKARISGIRPQDYTRMGFAIRHLTRLLKDSEARTKILITLSDGKPDDYNDYRGVYGIEDTRRALIEARRDGIHPYCITIDEKARDYLPHLYGSAAFTVIDEVRRLPLKLSDIYRRLTTR